MKRAWATLPETARVLKRSTFHRVRRERRPSEVVSLCGAEDEEEGLDLRLDDAERAGNQRRRPPGGENCPTPRRVAAITRHRVHIGGIGNVRRIVACALRMRT